MGEEISASVKEGSATQGGFDDLWRMEYLEGKKQAGFREKNNDIIGGDAGDQSRDAMQEYGLRKTGVIFF